MSTLGFYSVKFNLKWHDCIISFLSKHIRYVSEYKDYMCIITVEIAVCHLGQESKELYI